MRFSVTDIRIYPIKSCRGISLPSAVVEPRGVTRDRRFMLVDARGRFISQREQPRMALIGVSETDDGYLVEAPGQDALELPRELEGVRECRVRVHRDALDAKLADPGVNRWFTRFMGTDCGLVYMAAHQHRAVRHASAEFDDEVSFADGAPLLLISEASLDDLNARLARPVSMRRFRPNLVVTADKAFDEDGWGLIRVGEAQFEVAWPCSRCILTTVDPDSGERDEGGEPLETLKTFRRVNGPVMFGQNLLPRKLGKVRVGDEVEVLRWREA